MAIFDKQSLWGDQADKGNDACNSASGQVGGTTYYNDEYYKMMFIGII